MEQTNELMPLIEELTGRMPYGILIIDREYHIYFASEKIETILGLKQKELLKQKLNRYFVFENDQILEKGNIVYFTKYFEKPKHLIGIRYESKHLSNGKIILYLEGTYESTGYIQAKAESSNGFISSVTHEIRTPVNIISNAARLMFSMSKDQEVSCRHLNIIQKNTNIILRLVANLLTLCKNEEVDWCCDFRRDDVISHICDCVDAIEDYIKSYGIRLIKKIEVQKATALFDTDMLDKILSNLISNAIKFSNPENAIELIVKKKNDHIITVSVKDYGIGISPEDQNMIFEKYKQTKSTTIIRNQGSGIGLHIVKTFVEKMGFSIECKSQPNIGSEFIISIPVSGIVTRSSLSDQKAYIPSPARTEKLAIEFSDCF